jgi:DNA repair protein RecN (Recombination protein N)
MLTHLTVENYALIDKLELRIAAGFTTITGETGAGKSILLGALSLILGSRADTQALLDKERKCIVEGEFHIAGLDLESFFAEYELDHDETTIVRREINPQGKSRAFINDTPVNLSVLRDLSVRLIDIHSQHRTLELNDAGFQVSVVDSFAGQHEKVRQYQHAFKEYKMLRKQLKELEEQDLKQRKDQDYYQFQFDEMEQAKLQAGELAALETEMNLLTHAESIREQLLRSMHLLQEQDNNILASMSQVQQSLQQAARFDERLQGLVERMNSSLIELRDLASEAEQHASKVQYDPKRAEFVSQRLDLLYRLLQKHQVKTVEDLLLVLTDIESKLLAITSMEARMETCKKQLQEATTVVTEMAEILSGHRQKIIPQVQKKLKEVLKNLGIPDAQIRIACEPVDELNAFGKDRVIFYFSANKGTDLCELARVASGGELSRLMLAIKSLISQQNLLPTIIFDEIDSGVSGEVAGKVGDILFGLSKTMQVIAITHLPQIAARGRSHLYVYKKSGPEQTHTFIRPLADEERVKEIAQMITGAEVTEHGLGTARELLKM